jgi:hypothetical protein
MVALTAAQTRNLRAAIGVATDPAVRVRIAFAAWSESRGLVLANGGLNTSRSPGFDTHPQWPGILRMSLALPHDGVGNNGRSVGMFQQIPADVGGVWGPMVGCMTPTTSAEQFYAHLRVTDDPVFKGKLLRPDGKLEPVDVTLDPIAADVLRVQQPLADEARSSNYDASQVAVAKAIVAQLFPPTTDEGWFIDMADQDALNRYANDISTTVWERQYNDPNAPAGQVWPTPMRAYVIEMSRRVVAIEQAIGALGGVWDTLYDDPMAPDGQQWPTPMHTFITETNRRINHIEQLVQAIAAKVGA